MNLMLVLGAALATGAAALLILALKYAHESFKLRRAATHVVGHVSGHLPAPSDGDGPATFVLEVTFEYGGHRYVCQSNWSSSGPRKIGRAQPVLIPAGRPREARVHSFLESWGVALCLGVLGVASLAFGVLLIASSLSPSAATAPE